MTDQLGRRTGSALVWKAAQVLGTRLVSLARTLVLARILAPEDFGLVAVAAITVELLVGLSDFGFVEAVMQRRDVTRRHYDAAWTARVLRSAVLAAVIVGTAPWIAAGFDQPDAQPLLQLLAFRPLLDALASIRFAEFERDLDFRRVAVVALSGVVVETVVAIALAPRLGAMAIVVGALAGGGTGLVLSYLAAPHLPRPTLAREVTGQLFAYGRWIYVASVVGVLGDVVLQAVVSRRLGGDQLGVYYLATRLALLPAQSVSVVFVGVVFPLHARLQDEVVRATRLYRSNVVALLALLAPPYAVLVALGGPLVDALLGDRWSDAIPLVPMLAGVGLLGCVVYATLPMLDGRGRPHAVAGLFAVRSAVLLVFAWWLAGALGVKGAVLALLLAEAAIAVGCLALAVRALDRPLAGLVRPVLGLLVAASIGGLLGHLVGEALGGLAGLLGGIATVLVVTVLLDATADRLLRLGLARDVVAVYPAAGRLLRTPQR